MRVEVIGWGATFDYLTQLDRNGALQHEHKLLEFATQSFKEIPGVTLYGTAKEKTSVITFTLAGVHTLDFGVLIGLKGIALRTGSMCAGPALHHFGLQTAARVSFGIYTTEEDVARFLKALEEIRSLIRI